jgi:hypothetical protein
MRRKNLVTLSSIKFDESPFSCFGVISAAQRDGRLERFNRRMDSDAPKMAENKRIE